MAPPGTQGALFALESTVVQVNGHCQIRSSGELCVVVVRGLPIAHFTRGGRMSEALAMVNLIELGYASQREVARAFGRSDRTVQRQVRRYEEGGHAAQGRGPGYPRGRPRLPEKRRELIEGLVAEGVSRRQIAARLGVDEKEIRKLKAPPKKMPPARLRDSSGG
jgi:transposase